MKKFIAIVLTCLFIAACAMFAQYQGDKYQRAMHQAVVNYLSKDKVIKVSTYDNEMAVAKYIDHTTGRTCETHVVKALHNPQVGLFGTLCQ